MYLVSVRDLPTKIDSLPLQLLDESAPSLAGVFAENEGLAERFGGWLIRYRPSLWKEVVTMNPKVPTPIPPEEIAKLPGIATLLRDVPPQWFAEALGDEQKEKFIEELLKSLPPERGQELLRKIQEPPKANGGEGGRADDRERR